MIVVQGAYSDQQHPIGSTGEAVEIGWPRYRRVTSPHCFQCPLLG